MVRLLTSLLVALLLMPGLVWPDHPLFAQSDAGAGTPPAILINQVSTDPENATGLGAVELFDGGTGAIDLSGLSLVLFDRRSARSTIWRVSALAKTARSSWVAVRSHPRPR
jgi:hypothetical protein